jgi:hypothetical protein
MAVHQGPTEHALDVQALLTRAREQDGIDLLWTLTVASEVLREQQAPPGSLDRIERQLRTCMDGYARGHDTAVAAALIDALAALAREAY